MSRPVWTRTQDAEERLTNQMSLGYHRGRYAALLAGAVMDLVREGKLIHEVVPLAKRRVHQASPGVRCQLRIGWRKEMEVRLVERRWNEVEEMIDSMMGEVSS